LTPASRPNETIRLAGVKVFISAFGATFAPAYLIETYLEVMSHDILRVLVAFDPYRSK
jgi:hypothetical protein